eukprot:TRINITY_DN5661_c0_g2_i1.p1 TRINITY_DN5661_c0_g2~~TRINITY_DN5661_c0_g2_i1.p1  ORF type:complete len:474 (+),score=105.33 TRINITY_DN5661_c0_g2_i1:143-1564(+)
MSAKGHPNFADMQSSTEIPGPSAGPSASSDSHIMPLDSQQQQQQQPGKGKGRVPEQVEVEIVGLTGGKLEALHMQKVLQSYRKHEAQVNPPRSKAAWAKERDASSAGALTKQQSLAKLSQGALEVAKEQKKSWRNRILFTLQVIASCDVRRLSFRWVIAYLIFTLVYGAVLALCRWTAGVGALPASGAIAFVGTPAILLCVYLFVFRPVFESSDDVFATLPTLQQQCYFYYALIAVTAYYLATLGARFHSVSEVLAHPTPVSLACDAPSRTTLSSQVHFFELPLWQYYVNVSTLTTLVDPNADLTSRYWCLSCIADMPPVNASNCTARNLFLTWVYCDVTSGLSLEVAQKRGYCESSLRTGPIATWVALNVNTTVTVRRQETLRYYDTFSSAQVDILNKNIATRKKPYPNATDYMVVWGGESVAWFRFEEQWLRHHQKVVLLGAFLPVWLLSLPLLVIARKAMRVHMIGGARV